MSKLKNKLDYLNKKDKIKKQWETIDSQEGLSTRQKLEKLVNLGLKRKEKAPETAPLHDIHEPQDAVPPDEDSEAGGFTVREFSYPLDAVYGKFSLDQWKHVSPGQLAVITGEDEFLSVSPAHLLFFDTETTGLSGGTGTIPFMLGFGYFEEDDFRVKIFILNDLDREDEFLEEVDTFLQSRTFSATVTYNGKGFDFPLMETRYVLQRKRFPLLKLPHLDFLFPARTLWKHTYTSRKLGHLGDILLGISREEDVDAARIPTMYFNYLRSGSYAVIQRIVEHNALDLVGLAGLLLLGVKYLEDISHTADEGEILGTAKLFEKYGDFETADGLYKNLKQSAMRKEVMEKAVKGLALILKKKKLYAEAAELWEMLSGHRDRPGPRDRHALRELSVHLEHREKNFVTALEWVREGLKIIDLTDAQRRDFEKRYKRLNKKIQTLDKD
jgi:uncharacterized protein YprB with RNaseH-like and TPR domain